MAVSYTHLDVYKRQHTGSEIKDPEVFLQGLEIMFELSENFPKLRYIDMGSGFKVPYQKGEMEDDVKSLGKKVEKAVANFKKETGKDFELWFEPGKYLVSKSGHFLVKSNVIKQTTATVFVGVNSGFNHLIRPMFYDSYHIIENLSNPKGPERIYTVVGNICETDTFAWDRKLHEVRESDVLVFRNAGAVSYTHLDVYKRQRYNNTLNLSAEEITQSEITIYPNPAKDILTFKTTEKIRKAEIYDLNGRLVKVELGISNNQIDVSSLKTGTYVIKVTSDKKYHQTKFIKQ